MLLANRAESYMGLGRLDEAIRGYREALASLLYDELRGYGVTTLWALAVALDRNGDLEDGLEQIRLARTYDEFDERINGDAWFYSPPHDEHWYKALGAWVKARAAANSIDRIFEYGHALEAWDRYIDRAPTNDPYVPLAKVRRRACEIERERATHTSPQH
jgi:tetratricopeptide (TPR) repeat protein